MADRDDLDFTYSLIDRIFRLSLGELADFSGAKYDGDFSLTLEQAQRRKHEYVAEQIGIEPGQARPRPRLRLGAAARLRPRAGGHRRRRHALLGAGEACRRHGLDVHLRDARQVTPRRLRALRRGRQPRRLRAFLLARGARRRAPGRDLPRPLRPHRRPPAAGGRLYLQTMVYGRNMIPLEEVDIDAPRDSDAWYLALMAHQFPGSFLPYGQEQVIDCAEPRFRLLESRAAGSTTWRRSASGAGASANRASGRR